MSSLWRITPRAIRWPIYRTPMRGAHNSGATKSAAPPPKVLDGKASGFLAYARNVSRDKNYDQSQVALKGNTPMTFLTRRLGHAYETYPLFILTGWWFFLFSYFSYIAFQKSEVWLDRSQELAPSDWQRCKDDYWKRHTTAFDMFGNTHRRIPELEILQNEMLEAARKRGTRS